MQSIHAGNTTILLPTWARRAEHAEALAMAAHAAHEALAGEGGSVDVLNSATSVPEGASRYDSKLGEYAEALREAGYVLRIWLAKHVVIATT